MPHDRMGIGVLSHLLSVVEDESAEEDESSVEGDGPDPCAECGGGREEGGAEGGGQHHAEPHRQRTTHSQELLARSAGGH